MRHSDDPNGADAAFWALLHALPTLPREEEVALARAWRDHEDRAAFDRLILAHGRMVTHAASRFSGYGIPKKELTQAGMLGLTIAAQRFDPEREFRFVSYARHWVSECIRDCIVEHTSAVHMSTREKRTALFGRGQTEAREQLTLIATPDPLDAPIGGSLGEEDRSTHADRIASDEDSPEDNALEASERAKYREWLAAALTRLPDRDRRIVQARLLTDPPVPFDVLRAEFNLTRERLRQIEKAALRRIAIHFDQEAVRAGDMRRADQSLVQAPKKAIAVSGA